MANKRIYDLDPASAYSTGYAVEVDLSNKSLPESRAMPISVLSPKISDESTIANSSVNTATWILRLSSGTNDEYQKTLDDFFKLFSDKFNRLTDTFYNADGDSVGQLVLQRILNMVTGSLVFTGTSSWNEYRQLYTDQTGDPGSILSLPAIFHPLYTSEEINFYSVASESFNKIKIKSDGGVEVWKQNKNADALMISYICDSNDNIF